MSFALPHRLSRPDFIDHSLIVPFLGTFSACFLAGVKKLGFYKNILDNYSYRDLAIKSIPFIGTYAVAQDVARASKIKKIYQEAQRAERLAERAIFFAKVSRAEARLNDLVVSEWSLINGKLMTVLTLIERSLEETATFKDDKKAQEAAFHALVAIKGKKAFNTSSSAINMSKCITSIRSCHLYAKDFRGMPDIECVLARINEAKAKAFYETRSALVDAMKTVELRLYV